MNERDKRIRAAWRDEECYFELALNHCFAPTGDDDLPPNVQVFVTLQNMVYQGMRDGQWLTDGDYNIIVWLLELQRYVNTVAICKRLFPDRLQQHQSQFPNLLKRLAKLSKRQQGNESPNETIAKALKAIPNLTDSYRHAWLKIMPYPSPQPIVKPFEPTPLDDEVDQWRRIARWFGWVKVWLEWKSGDAMKPFVDFGDCETCRGIMVVTEKAADNRRVNCRKCGDYRPERYELEVGWRNYVLSEMDMPPDEDGVTADRGWQLLAKARKAQHERQMRRKNQSG